MKRVLVVIDMQEGTAKGRYHGQYLNKKWWRRHAGVVAAIITLSQKMKTIFQVHTGFRLKKHVGVVSELQPIAQRGNLVFKRQDDGSDELLEYISKNTHIYVCGMNTDACVLRTVRGLKSKGYAVTVIGDACWTAYASKSTKPHHQALSVLRKNGASVINASAVR